nr:MAG TPA: 24-sterol C-methyltransferase [Caudoviricetes sp.]
METGTISGYISEDIKYCPYCGARLYSQTHCCECGRGFYVIDGEQDNE